MYFRSHPALLLIAAPFLALPLAGCFAHQFRTKPRVAVVDGDPIVQMQPSAKLPSLLAPQFAPIETHTDPPAPWEPVIGVHFRESARGYPLGLLDRYEVVNDTLEDLPYVVMRCALTQITAVYDRRVAGRILTFFNSGALWRDTLVVQDRETGTLWTAATGRALFGPLSGTRLQPIPAVIATSDAWSDAFPGAPYLDTGEMSEKPLLLGLYSVSPWQGVSGVKTADGRYEPKAEVYAVGEGDEAIAFTEDDLKRSGPVREILDGRAVLLEWDAGLDAPRAFRPDDACVEVAVVPMYWFAVNRHYETVHTLPGRSVSSPQHASR